MARTTSKTILFAAFALLFTLAAVGLGTDARAQSAQVGPSGLPLPRFVSLKSDRVNVRQGPSQDHAISWTYVHAGLPVEIIQEFDTWRRVRDWDGREGWVFHSLLSGRRTALVTPWEDANTSTLLRAEPRDSAAEVAELKSKVLVDVSQCENSWCLVEGDNFRGWINQTRLFGVYPNETIK